MEIVLVGVSHKTAPVETRERLAVLDAHVPAFFEALRGTPSLRECAIVSTCNRTELYAVGETSTDIAEAIVTQLSLRNGLTREALAGHLYQHRHDDAVRHLFSVSAGLDSLIVGEGQILAQVRKALQLSQDHGSAGTVVGKLFERALRVGKRARTETRISQGASSVSFAAVELARRIHGDLARKRVLILGTGKMGVLTLKLLINAGVASITVLSRREETARRMMGEVLGPDRGRFGGLEQLDDALTDADIVISCTAAPLPIVTAARVRAVQRRRKYRPLFIVDIAVPRDVEAAVNDIDGVFLYNVDDLSSVVQDSLAERAGEIDQVRLIIEEELEGFLRYCATLETVPVIRQLREAFESRRQREVDALLARERLSDAERQRFEAFSRSLLARLLHEPTLRVKDLASRGDTHAELHFLLDVFAEGVTPSSAGAQKPSDQKTSADAPVGQPVGETAPVEPAQTVDRQEETAP